MISLNQVSKQINDCENFQGLFEVYEDLAAQKMQKIRDEISKYREFAKVMTGISGELGDDISGVIKKKAKQKVSVLVTSDKGLYGEVFEEMAKVFTDDLATTKQDAYVVGSLGVKIVKRLMPNANYVAVDTDEASLADLWKKLGEYQEIFIYYLKYNSLTKQNLDIVHVSGELIPGEQVSYEYNEEVRLKFLYEPSVVEIAEVFAGEVLSFLSEQAMKEADLAKYAARLVYLDSCLERNKENLTTTMTQKRILSKRLSNKRQNARMAGYLIRNNSN